MNRLLFALIIAICSSQLYASHVAGGSIWYEYIGDSTGIPNHYIIHLELLRRNESGSAGLSGTMQVVESSSCYSSQTHTLNRIPPPAGHSATGDGGYLPPSSKYCRTLSNSDPNNFNISVHHYITSTVLSGPCSDYTFSYSMCCMNANIVNLQDPSSITFYIESTLDNTTGQNSSPNFLMAPLHYYCLGKPVVSHYSAIDPDGDSLFYTLSPVLAGSSGVYAQYNSGYTASQPIASTSGISLNNQTGALVFTPSQIEVNAVRVELKDYRMIDTVNHIYKLVGTISRQTQYVISSTCDSSQTSMTFKKDASGTTVSINAKCNDSIVSIDVEPSYVVSTLASDGSDFAIISKASGAIIPIVKAVAGNQNNSIGLANEVNLHLYKPLFYNDTYYIVSKVGSDTNTISTICGVNFPANDTLSFAVSDCNTEFDLAEISSGKIELYPSPASNSITIEIEQKDLPIGIKAVIYNLEGQKVKVFQLQNSKQSVSVSDLPPGIYWVSIPHGDAPVVRKFIKI